MPNHVQLFVSDQAVGLSRRQWFAWALALPAVGLLAACDKPSIGPAGGAGSPIAGSFKGIDVTGAPYGKGFALTDMRGQPRTLDDFKGKVVMLYFGFVQCPDVCPTALTRANEVMGLLGAENASQVQVIFVTVDPERDTPELLQNYMAAFNPGFLALYGTPEQTEQAAKEFRVFYKKVPTGSTYTMDHTSLSYLFDPRGRFRVALRHEQTAADHAADIAALLRGA
jgi:protein SCO1/2